MSLKYIKNNVERIGISDTISLLKDLISNSNDVNLRKEALKFMESIDDGNNFTFLEQIFLSDENLDIKLSAGNILKAKYRSQKKIIPLLEYTLNKVDCVEQKLLSVKILGTIDNHQTRKILDSFLKNTIKTKHDDKREDFPEDIFILNQYTSIPQSLLDVCFNLILFDYYMNKCGYKVMLRNGKIISLNCESVGLKEISDIIGIHNLVHLEHLSLQKNSIEKISSLEHLHELKVLNLNENCITKIENLQALRNLEELHFSYNKITKIENLNSLKHLKMLSLNGNCITKIKNLDSLSELEELNLSRNNIILVENLENLIKLKTLNLSFNQIELIEGIEKLIDLTWLRLNDNKITSIQGIKHLKKLKGLYLSNNDIKRISGLENLEELRKLDLSNNDIHKIEGLNDLMRLQELFLDRNHIKKLEGLNNLNGLIILFLEKNEIKEYDSVLDELNSLNFVFLNENPLTPESFKLYKKRTKYP